MKKIKKLLLPVLVALTLVGGAQAVIACADGADDGGGGINAGATLTVNTSTVTNGTVATDKTSYVSGDTVVLTFTPDSGYTLSSVKVNGVEKIADVADGKLSIATDAGDTALAVTAIFEALPASVNIAESENGSVRALGSTHKVGGNLVLAITPDPGYELDYIRINDVDKTAAVTGASLTVKIDAATVNVEAAFKAVRIKYKVLNSTPDGGSLTLDKEAYEIGDTCSVTVEPAQGYVLDKLTVCGEGAAVTDNAYSFIVKKVNNPVISVSFKLTPIDLDFVIQGHKSGALAPLAEGTRVKLKSAISETEYTATVGAEGRVKIDGVDAGSYTLSVEGYYGKEVSFGKEGLSSVTVEYQRFTPVIGWQWSAHDLSHVNDEDPTITVRDNNATLDVISVDKYDDVMATIVMKESNSINDIRLQGIWLRFEDGKLAVLTVRNDNEGYRASWVNQSFGDGWDLSIVNGNDWVELKKLTAAEQASFKGEGLEVSVVRKGRELLAIIGGEAQSLLSLSAGYRDDKVQVGFLDYDSAAGATWSFDITSDLTAAATVDADIQNGSITLDKTSCAMGDRVTVTATPAAGYLLKSITVAGKTLEAAGGTYSFVVAGKSVTVSAVFEALSQVNVDFAISGKKLGKNVALGSVTLTNKADPTYTYTYDCSGGRFTMNGVAVGTYTVTAAGYKSREVEVAPAGVGGAVALECDIFDPVKSWDWDKHDLSHVNDETPSISIASGSLDVLTKENYDQAAVTLYAKYYNSNHEFHTNGIWLKFDDGKFMILHIGDEGGLGACWVNSIWDLPVVTGGIAYPLTQGQADALKGAAGLKTTVVRNGNVLSVLLDDVFAGSVTLADGYKTRKVQVGFMCYDGVANASWRFDITDDMTAYASAVSVTPAENGTVSADKTSCSIGDLITLTVTPADGYIIKAVKIDGVVLEQTGGRYVFNASRAAHTVTAEFEQLTEADISFTASGKKYGETVEFTTVTLTNKTDASISYTLTAANGKFEKTGVAVGEYTVDVTGYIAGSLSVAPTGVPEDTAITLLYNKSFVFDPGYGWEMHDLSKIHTEGKIVHRGKGPINMLSQETFNDVAVTLIAGKSMMSDPEGVQGIWLKFDDGKWMIVNVRREGGYPIAWVDKVWGDMSDGGNTVLGQTIEVKRLSTEEVDAFNGDGLALTVMRRGDILSVFANGNFAGSIALGADYRDDNVKVGFMSYDTAETEAEWGFSIRTDVSAYASRVTVATAENGTVSCDKSDCYMGEKAVVTVAPAAGYIVASVSVDNAPITPVNGVYSFYVSKADHRVAAVFVEADVASVSFKVAGKKLGETVNLGRVAITKTDDATITYSADCSSGTFALDNVAVGAYTVSSDGYKTASLTVTNTGVAEGTEVSLEFDLFRPQLGWCNDLLDVSKVNTEKKIGMKGEGTFETISNSTYGDVSVTLNYKRSNITTLAGANEIQGIWMQFAGGWVITYIEKDGNGDNYLAWQMQGSKFEGIPAISGLPTWGYHKLSDEEIAAFGSDSGIDFTLCRSGNVLWTYFNGKRLTDAGSSARLAPACAGEKIRVGFFSHTCVAGAEWKFDIKESVPEEVISYVQGDWSLGEGSTAASGTFASGANARGSVQLAKKHSSVSVSLELSGIRDRHGLRFLTANGNSYVSFELCTAGSAVQLQCTPNSENWTNTHAVGYTPAVWWGHGQDHIEEVDGLATAMKEYLNGGKVTLRVDFDKTVGSFTVFVNDVQILAVKSYDVFKDDVFIEICSHSDPASTYTYSVTDK